MSPFLFLWNNMEVSGAKILSEIYALLADFQIDKNSLFHLSDSGESIKIEEMRNFLAKGNEKPRFNFQVFFIENISRMTVQSANAALKFFEEPGKGNIIILTNASEADVLDTILSRVQVVRLQQGGWQIQSTTYIDMVTRYFQWWDTDLISLLYTQKLEKSDYKEILYAFFQVFSKKWVDNDTLSELEKDMQGLEKNNLNGKYIVDKYLTI